MWHNPAAGRLFGFYTGLFGWACMHAPRTRSNQALPEKASQPAFSLWGLRIAARGQEPFQACAAFTAEREKKHVKIAAFISNHLGYTVLIFTRKSFMFVSSPWCEFTSR
ncbi:uncharacterized protein NEMAJ01_0441 [Nematocida major]|uniref:uncharacterized protein n=1 Tax=Nematocida major TaxID=1912982 RepID=UPI002008BC64|nr:uncharacterized protein NEMAJ01_0441 [Nematocida major]KAH9385545.1 hypothetical protein NEMAJ01_0441 [Nematocida major]